MVVRVQQPAPVPARHGRTEIKKKAIEQGMLSLRRSGLIKVAAEVSSLEEVVRETVL